MVNTDFSLANSKFNDFLFEPIGDDARGITISMFSGLARLDLDPWREAARIAALPIDLARRAIAERIKQLNVSTWDVSEDGHIAARLAKLLPRPGRLPVISERTVFPKSLASLAPWLAFLLATGVLLAMSLGVLG
jgi:hypothetical protein